MDNVYTLQLVRVQRTEGPPKGKGPLLTLPDRGEQRPAANPGATLPSTNQRRRTVMITENEEKRRPFLEFSARRPNVKGGKKNKRGEPLSGGGRG